MKKCNQAAVVEDLPPALPLSFRIVTSMLEQVRKRLEEAIEEEGGVEFVLGVAGDLVTDVHCLVNEFHDSFEDDGFEEEEEDK